MKLTWALQDDWLQLRIGQFVQLRGQREEKFYSEIMAFTSNGIRLLSLPTIWKTSYWEVYVQVPKTPKPKPIKKTLPTDKGMYVSWVNKQVPTFFFYHPAFGWNQGTDSETKTNGIISLYMPLHRLIEQSE